MITKSKITDACDSVLYPKVLERFDGECASESKNQYLRECMEHLAELLAAEARHDTEKCRLLLAPEKKLREAYGELEKTAKALKILSASDAWGLKIAGNYYGFYDGSKKAEAKAEKEKKTPERADTAESAEVEKVQGADEAEPSAEHSKTQPATVSLFDFL